MRRIKDMYGKVSIPLHKGINKTRSLMIKDLAGQVSLHQRFRKNRSSDKLRIWHGIPTTKDLAK